MATVAEIDAVAGLQNREEVEGLENVYPELSCDLDPPVAPCQNMVESSMAGAQDVFVGQYPALPPQNTPLKSTIVVPDGSAPNTTGELIPPEPHRSNIRLLLNDHDTHVNYGRGYVDGHYWIPNDEKQENQLDMAHHLYLLVLGDQLYVAPIAENPRKVLDIGTGTGIWAMEFAVQHPSAQVIGCDFSPVYNARDIHNVLFEVKDVRDPWGYEQSSFDFIHARGMNGYDSEWPTLYKQVFVWVYHGLIMPCANRVAVLSPLVGGINRSRCPWALRPTMALLRRVVSLTSGVRRCSKLGISVEEIFEPMRRSKTFSRPSVSRMSTRPFISSPLGHGARISA